MVVIAGTGVVARAVGKLDKSLDARDRQPTHPGTQKNRP
jgi:hypothetical protein